MGTLQEGVEQVVANCLRVASGERVVIITDKNTRFIAEALRDRIVKVGCDPTFFVMEEFHERPLPELPDEMKQAVKNTDVSIYAAQTADGELGTFRLPLLKTISANEKIRHAHMIQITKEIMEQGMCVDYAMVKEVTAKVKEAVTGASEIKVTTPLGTDLTVQLNPKTGWITCDGNITPGTWTNLPDGETFTCPESVDGTAIVDGVLGDICQKFGSLKNNPVTVKYKDGRATDIQCENKEIQKLYSRVVFETDENSNRVGEFAFGTNLGVKKLIGCMLQDEKFPSIHMATGDPLETLTEQVWHSKTHVDGVITTTTAVVDGKTIMKDGKYLIL